MQHPKYKLRDFCPNFPIHYGQLSRNTHQGAIQLLKERIKGPQIDYNCHDVWPELYDQETIDWIELSANPSAVELLECNPHKIDWKHILTI